MADPETVGLSFIMVADAAQSIGGKVYVLGGGWDRILLPEVPGRPIVPFSVAAGLAVPWHMTNRKLSFSIDLRDADGRMVETLVAGEVEVGRPPGLRPGASQAVHLAGPANPEFPAEGRYVIACSVDAEPLGHTAIEVVRSGSQP